MKAYQLKVTIKKSKPPIWRRCIVPGEISFSQLTHILRKVIGWSGYHLSEYSFNGLKIKLVENASEDDWMWDYEVLDSSEYLIDDFFSAAKSFSYVYDFGDWWDHEVKIEKIIEDHENNYPIVTKYKGITPPEDCGGIYGYYQMMDTLSDSKNPEYEEMKEWYGDDSEYEYNLEAVNNRLSAMTVTNKKIKPISERELDEKYLGSGRMPLDKVKGKGMPVSVLGNGKTKYEKEFKKFSGIMDSFFDELSKTPQYKDQIKQLLSKGIEPVPDFTYDFEKIEFSADSHIQK
ncbi:MAG: plasmid pRiA4b ORF-3 family protein [Butyrivibrio sp.]|nr:plasmid pRiA4b ORF-3 family protein [Butyrivibrio sp.]